MDGIGTSPRAWWLFKLYKHKNVSVLNGGMKAWKALNGPINNKITKIYKSNYMANIDHSILAKYEDVKNLYNNKDYQVVDARSLGRFLGKEKEPRPGLQKGHIPHSINIPFNIFTPEYVKRDIPWGLKPLTRDGAAFLYHGFPLYGVTEQADEHSLVRDMKDLYD